MLMKNKNKWLIVICVQPITGKGRKYHSRYLRWLLFEKKEIKICKGKLDVPHVINTVAKYNQ